jgi:4-amino-4-deoxy-L-arabinose transferase-like glycosyltransferase
VKEFIKENTLFLISVSAALLLGIYEITGFPVRTWDEGRLAVNAFEMHENGDWLATHYAGAEDTWNTKPPLVIWLQVISMKIFGVNDFAFRLPTAIAFVFLVAMIFRFSVSNLCSENNAFLIILITLTTGGLMREHVFRTGDYDAFLVVAVTGYAFSFYEYLVYKKHEDLIWFTVYLALAGLVKGIAGLIPLAGIGLFVLFFSFNSLKDYRIYLAGIAGMLIIAAYYFVREKHSPGYLGLINNNELAGRFAAVTEEHNWPWYYYLLRIFGKQFFPWFLLIPPAFYLVITEKNAGRKQLLIYLLTVCVIFILVHSSSRSKLTWYHVPVFPFLILVVGITLLKLAEILKYRKIVLTLVFLTAFVNFIIVSENEKQKLKEEPNRINLRDKFPDILKETRLYTYCGLASPVVFGIQKINYHEGARITVKPEPDFRINDSVVVFNGVNEHAMNKYEGEKVFYSQDVSVYRILSNK